MVLVAIVLSFLIKTFLFRAFYIPSESMVNTLDVNDRIFVNLLVPEPFALEHGDVVVFRDTQGWLVPMAEKEAGPFTWVQDGLTFIGLLPDNSEQHLVKRVVGLPGDRIEVRSHRVYINGEPLKEPYVNLDDRAATHPSRYSHWGPEVVPPGQLFVMGDNRDNSADGRDWGFLDSAQVKGRAFMSTLAAASA